jgi:hypothetical protein
MKKKILKKYIAIVKVADNPNGSAKCLKYRFNDLLKFTTFLDKDWRTWRWFNVYANKGNYKGEQLDNFTNKRRPLVSKL